MVASHGRVLAPLHLNADPCLRNVASLDEEVTGEGGRDGGLVDIGCRAGPRRDPAHLAIQDFDVAPAVDNDSIGRRQADKSHVEVCIPGEGAACGLQW